MAAAEGHQLPRLFEHRSPLGRAGHARATASTELEQALITQQAQRTQHGVGVDAQLSREIARRRKPFTRSGLTVQDRAPDGAGHLLKNRRRLGPVDLQPIGYHDKTSLRDAAAMRGPQAAPSTRR